jgi:biopolymer transport protein ExbD
MAHAALDDGDEVISGINVTPLVDVVLVLLIIFIVTASFLMKSAIPVDLPAAASGEQRAQGLLSVTISKGGELAINGQPAALEGLGDAVKRAAEARGGEVRTVEAFVSADVAAPYGLFARVVDRLRVLGVTNIALDTRPEDQAAR